MVLLSSRYFSILGCSFVGFGDSTGVPAGCEDTMHAVTKTSFGKTRKMTILISVLPIQFVTRSATDLSKDRVKPRAVGQRALLDSWEMEVELVYRWIQYDSSNFLVPTRFCTALLHLNSFPRSDPNLPKYKPLVFLCASGLYLSLIWSAQLTAPQYPSLSFSQPWPPRWSPVALLA